jgi:glycosyltransferase involved in cell wall biosynthesis
MAEQPLVSIITPSYNQAPFLEETIVSVLGQDYPNLEYLVVDGGSTDGSVDVIRRHADALAWWTSEPDRGQAHALNKAFEHARGAYVGWVCSDDTLLPNAVSRLVSELERDPGLVLAYGDAVYTDERSKLKDPAPSGPWEPEEMVRTAQVPNQQPASLYARRGWESAGPLDEDAWYYLDFEFAVRLAGAGRGAHIPETVATYRIHLGGKSTGFPVRKAEDAIRCADGFMAGPLVPEPLRPYAREGRATLYWRAGENFYAALELGRARRCFVRSFVIAPRTASRATLSATAKSWLPRPVVRRLRARRVAQTVA